MTTTAAVSGMTSIYQASGSAGADAGGAGASAGATGASSNPSGTESSGPLQLAVRPAWEWEALRSLSSL